MKLMDNKFILNEDWTTSFGVDVWVTRCAWLTGDVARGRGRTWAGAVVGSDVTSGQFRKGISLQAGPPWSFCFSC